MNIENEIKVSVCVVTYNQEKYIAECLQSLVDQVTDFKFEIIVGEDCSTDNTRAVVDEFAIKYPDIIIRNYHENNIGPVQNVLSTYKMARGEYIAHLDGDDYALPGKLKKQVSALDENLDCTICSHDVVIVDAQGSILRESFKKHDKKINNLIDLYSILPFFSHSSKMFRNDMVKEFWNHLHKNALDIEIHVMQAKNGNIYHIDEVFGVYREGVGISLVNRKMNPILIEGIRRIFDVALTECQDKYFDYIKICYAKKVFSCAYRAAIYDDKISLREYIIESKNIRSVSIFQKLFFYLSHFPLLVVLICRFRESIIK
ncbi:glycosyltransferase [Acinetobacter cumulans]|uniref:glycosyltransferase family 2 protein n=1 Tax=Acinetobacter cumulans TaxID=2136182 RepID=UPI000EA161B6|nr:glycosyltransferase [Acinetobacter cumulans]RKG51430.1 glycosyltransferase [Acinetobacter cumulans]